MIPALVAMNRIVAASRPDVDLGRVLQRAQVQVLDDPQHRVAGEAALALGQAEQRLALAVHAV